MTTRTIAEPYRIKMVEALKTTTREHRDCQPHFRTPKKYGNHSLRRSHHAPSFAQPKPALNGRFATFMPARRAPLRNSQC